MIGNLLFYLVSYSLPVALMGLMWKLNARRWTRLARAYRAVDATDCVAMLPASVCGGD